MAGAIAGGAIGAFAGGPAGAVAGLGIGAFAAHIITRLAHDDAKTPTSSHTPAD
jgi:hypothetical protein